MYGEVSHSQKTAYSEASLEQALLHDSRNSSGCAALLRTFFTETVSSPPLFLTRACNKISEYQNTSEATAPDVVTQCQSHVLQV